MNSKFSDELIAHVAGRMTDAEPPARLRANVLARLDQHPSVRRWSWVPVVMTAAAAVAILAFWPHSQAPALPVLPTLAALSAPFTPATPSLTNDATPQSSPRSGVIARRVNAAAASADELEFWAGAIPALERPATLVLESIQPQPLSIPLLVISPLSSGATTAGGDGGK